MEARKLKRPNVGECQKMYDKYGIDDSNHTGTTTDLCAVIQELEQRSGSGQVDALVMLRNKIKAFKKANEAANNCAEMLLSKPTSEEPARLMKELEKAMQELYKEAT